MAMRNGKDTKNMYLYSGHDVTLVTLMRSMGLIDEHFIPEYGAVLIFELIAPENSKNDAELEVRVSLILII